jgi:hypothetical protein
MSPGADNIGTTFHHITPNLTKIAFHLIGYLGNIRNVVKVRKPEKKRLTLLDDNRAPVPLTDRAPRPREA